MGILVDILIVQAIIVFIIDLSGAVEDMVEPFLAKVFKQPSVRLKKPFSCSLCTTFWLGLLYIAIYGHFTLPYIAYVCLLAWMTPVTKDILILLREFILKALDAISIYFNI